MDDPAIAIFGSDDFDLYKTLNVESTASTDEIKRSYRRLALQYHPDKIAKDADKEDATTRFQQIGYAYAVLSDTARKERYDRTGSTESTFWEDKGDGFDWNEYFKSKWTGEVNAQTLDEFKAKYQGSKEEKEDLFSAYLEYKGDMGGIMDAVPCSSVLEGDEERFRSILQTAIDTKELKAYKAFAPDSTASKARVRAAKKEAREAEEYAREMGLEDKLWGKKNSKANGKENKEEDDLAGLAALIQQNREKKMNAMIDNLEAKYGAKGKRSEPSEEAFAATAARKTKKSKAK